MPHRHGGRDGERAGATGARGRCPRSCACAGRRGGGAGDRVPRGAIAQLGERLNGIQEVRGSTPRGSTKIAEITWIDRLAVSVVVGLVRYPRTRLALEQQRSPSRVIWTTQGCSVRRQPN